MNKKTHYFDYAATTPLDPKVLTAMMPYFTEKFGNPSNLYEPGRSSHKAIDASRELIADAFNFKPREFVFTGSATESDNIAILGVARANKEKGNRILVSAIEHKGILSACKALIKEGFEIDYIPTDRQGIIHPKELEKLLTKNTILVSITSADSETGTIQPIAQHAKIIKKFRAENKINTPYFHTDASQSAAYQNIDVEKLGVDLLTLSAHKMYGPKGIGGLFVRKGTNITPIIFGGGQQNALRSGTENVPGIVGFAEAVKMNMKNREKEIIRISRLRDRLERGIMKKIPKVVLNGHPKKRLANFLNISILDIEGEALLLHLDELGIMVNTGSACNSQTLEPSYVLTALGNPYEFVHGSIRFTLGKQTTTASVDYVLKNLPKIVKLLRNISPINLNLNQTEEMSYPKAFVGNQKPHFIKKKDEKNKPKK